LYRYLNNLISNSIESYNGKEGKIDLSVSKNGQELEIVVKDYGCGIPENVKRKLLKEMITTKGKNGTGLGLYMSHSTIKGKFGGTMKVKSEEGKRDGNMHFDSFCCQNLRDGWECKMSKEMKAPEKIKKCF